MTKLRIAKATTAMIAIAFRKGTIPAMVARADERDGDDPERDEREAMIGLVRASPPASRWGGNPRDLHYVRRSNGATGNQAARRAVHS